jgi:hypothetical protein
MPSSVALALACELIKALDRVKQLLRLHLRKGKGLLLMHGEVDWLQSQGLLPKGRAGEALELDERELRLRSLDALLKCIDAADLLDTALAPASPLDSLRANSEHVDQVLAQYEGQCKASLAAFQLLQNIVWKLLAKADKESFHMAVLWPGTEWHTAQRSSLTVELLLSIQHW